MSKKEFLVEASGHSNEVVSDLLAQERYHNWHEHVDCIDGKTRPMWECRYSTITKLEQNKATLQIRFKVWYRESRNAKAKIWPFTKKTKPTLVTVVKKGMVFKMPSQKINPVS